MSANDPERTWGFPPRKLTNEGHTVLRSVADGGRRPLLSFPHRPLFSRLAAVGVCFYFRQNLIEVIGGGRLQRRELLVRLKFVQP